MPKEQMWVEYEDGARLSRSAKKPGSFSPLTRAGGTNHLGQVTLDPIGGDGMLNSGPGGRSPLEDFLRDLAVDVTLAVLEKAKPHVEKWVVETAVPAAASAVTSAVPVVGSAVASAGSAMGSAVASAGSAVGSAAVTAGSAVGSAAVTAGSAVGSAAVTAGSAVGSAAVTAGSAVGSAAVTAGSAVGSTVSSAWNRVTRKKGKRVVSVESHIGVEPASVEAAPVEVGVVVDAAPADASQEVAAAVEAYRAGMSRAEARQRIVAALAARLFSEQQFEAVRSARIEHDAPELDGATLALAQEFGDGVQRMLESTPALLGEDVLADLRKILVPEPAEDGGPPERG